MPYTRTLYAHHDPANTTVRIFRKLKTQVKTRYLAVKLEFNIKRCGQDQSKRPNKDTALVSIHPRYFTPDTPTSTLNRSQYRCARAMISSNEITAFYLVLSFSITYVLGKILLRTLWRPRLHRDVVMDDCAADRGYKHFDPYSGIGLLLLIIRAYRGRRFLEMWEGLSIQLGHTFSFWLLGERIFVTSDPENVKVLLSSSFDTFEHGPSRRYAGKPLIGNGIFAVDGVEWSAARALLRPSFAKSQISDFDMLEHHFRNFLQALPVDGAAVDLQELFKCLSMDVITDMLFGTSTNSLTQSNDDEAVAFSDACEYSQKIVWRNFSLGWVGTFLPNPKDRKSRRLLHNTVNRYVRQVLQQESQLALPVHPDSNSGRKKYVFLEHLVERTRDPRVIRDQLMSALLGGRDTTSSLLSNLFHVLARKPDIWDRLRAEIRQIQNQPPTMEDIQRSKYARNCIQECEHSCKMPSL